MGGGAQSLSILIEPVCYCSLNFPGSLLTFVGLTMHVVSGTLAMVGKTGEAFSEVSFSFF